MRGPSTSRSAESVWRQRSELGLPSVDASAGLLAQARRWALGTGPWNAVETDCQKAARRRRLPPAPPLLAQPRETDFHIYSYNVPDMVIFYTEPAR